MVLPTEFISNHHTGTGLYVDVENLGDDAEALIKTLLDAWPLESTPKPSLVNLYVKADTTELWKTWALQYISSKPLKVHGIQHFTGQQSKNSADMAIAVDAIADFLHGQVSHVAVYSHDSDFISLFAKIRSEASDADRAPFLWILTDRSGKRTPNIDRFFPPENLYMVSTPIKSELAESQSSSTPVETVTFSDTPVTISNAKSQEESIAIAMIEEIGIGTFKSVDCQEVVRRRFPTHPGRNQSGAAFGEYISKSIWPHLERHGVRLVGQRPCSYEMTQAAKDSLPA